MPNFAIKITNNEDFHKLFSLTPLNNVCILFTNKNKTPMLYKSVSQEYKNRIEFIEVMSDLNIKELYNIDKFPTLLVVKKDKKIISKYNGLLNYNDIIKFLQPYAENKINRNDNEFPLSKNYDKTTKDKKTKEKPKSTKKIEYYDTVDKSKLVSTIESNRENMHVI